MSVDLKPWSIFCAFSHTFLLALATLVTFLRLRLGSGIFGPRAPLGEVDTNCNSSSFLKGVIKMDDINPFGERDKTDTAS